MTTISFPGLGIGEFTINKTAFTLPIGENGIPVAWYGIIIVTGIILGFLYCAYRSRQEGISLDDLTDIAIFTIVASIIGARAYYVISEYDRFFPLDTSSKDAFWADFGELFAINKGGIGIYGALIAGAATIIIVSRVKKWSWNKLLKFFDSLAPAVLIGQILGRWGNFCNGEAFGREIPESGSFFSFIRMGVISDASKNIFANNAPNAMHFVHPTFLYESVWNLIGFVVLHFIYKKKKFDGQILLSYIAWYGFGRMFIEYLRMDSLPLIFGTEAGGLNRLSLWVGFACFVIGTAIMTALFVKAAKAKKAGTYLPPVFLTEEEMKATWAPKKSKPVSDNVEQVIIKKYTEDSDADEDTEPTEENTEEVTSEETKENEEPNNEGENENGTDN